MNPNGGTRPAYRVVVPSPIVTLNASSDTVTLRLYIPAVNTPPSLEMRRTGGRLR